MIIKGIEPLIRVIQLQLLCLLQKGATIKGLQVTGALSSYNPEPILPPVGKKGTSALSALLELDQTQK